MYQKYIKYVLYAQMVCTFLKKVCTQKIKGMYRKNSLESLFKGFNEE